MSLPAAARRRWHLGSGGEVAWLDLGEAIVLLPGTLEHARAAVLDQLGEDEWRAAAQGFGDADLSNQ